MCSQDIENAPTGGWRNAKGGRAEGDGQKHNEERREKFTRRGGGRRNAKYGEMP